MTTFEFLLRFYSGEEKSMDLLKRMHGKPDAYPTHVVERQEYEMLRDCLRDMCVVKNLNTITAIVTNTKLR